MDKQFILCALSYGLVGLLLGIYMAASHNHGQMVTHAHIMLVGFVVSFIYAVMDKVWLGEHVGLMRKIQFYFHQFGALGMVVSLFLLYGGFLHGSVIGPFAAIFSMLVIVGFILMIWIYLKQAKT